MKIVPLTSIEVRGRQRKKIDPGPLNELKTSILERGLLHPPVVWSDGEQNVLTAGERRLEAVKLIAKEGKTFTHNNQPVTPGNIPVSELSDLLNDVGRFEAEFDENVLRVDFTWQEKTQALADLHTLRLSQNPLHTMKDTAREVVQKTGKSGTDSSVRSVAARVSDAVILSKHL